MQVPSSVTAGELYAKKVIFKIYAIKSICCPLADCTSYLRVYLTFHKVTRYSDWQRKVFGE